MVPLSVIIAALLETPTVSHIDIPSAGSSASSGHGGDSAASKVEPVQESGKPSASMGSGSMFDRIAFAYDTTNKWMSFGLDQFWRKTLIQNCMTLERDDHVLDLATGTADVSLLAGKRLRELGGAQEEGTVLGVDPSSEMLRRGVMKVEDQGLKGAIRLVKGDAQDLSAVQNINAEGTVSLPMPGVATDSINKISMSFGIRNVPDRARAFREMRRVLHKKPSSRVCILEFSLPTGETPLSKAARNFILHVIPFLGKLGTRGTGAAEYEYLERSIVEFPQPRVFAASMTAEGLAVKTITSFAFGSVHLYEAVPV